MTQLIFFWNFYWLIIFIYKKLLIFIVFDRVLELWFENIVVFRVYEFWIKFWKEFWVFELEKLFNSKNLQLIIKHTNQNSIQNSYKN